MNELPADIITPDKKISIPVEETAIIQDQGLNRNTIDKYYTNDNVVSQCIELIKEFVNPTTDDLIIEPSAGSGAFIDLIKKLSLNYRFYDIEPEHKEIIKKDFLELNTTQLEKKFSTIHVIGNPPFGRQASLAIKFIKKCCSFASSISFILPKSFKKASMQKHFSLNFHLICESDVPDDSFLINKVPADVPCVFQIWKRFDVLRESTSVKLPVGFKFVKKHDTPDVSFRRVGVNAGVISKDIDNKSEQSHYFIKFTNGKSVDVNLKKLTSIEFETNNTVGPKSISKQELIEAFGNLTL